MSAHTDSQQVVVFSLGGEQYALPIASVSEIIRYTPPRSIASADRYTHGVIGLRGKIVPVFDLAARTCRGNGGRGPRCRPAVA
jgi:purine-binding chemotaxis protein CheW